MPAFSYRRNRRQADPSNLGLSKRSIVATPSVVATKLRLTFDQAYSLTGIPQVGLTGGAHTGTAYPTSATVISPTVMELDYDAVVAAGDVMTMAPGDVCCRSMTGACLSVKSSVLV